MTPVAAIPAPSVNVAASSDSSTCGRQAESALIQPE